MAENVLEKALAKVAKARESVVLKRFEEVFAKIHKMDVEQVSVAYWWLKNLPLGEYRKQQELLEAHLLGRVKLLRLEIQRGSYQSHKERARKERLIDLLQQIVNDNIWFDWNRV